MTPYVCCFCQKVELPVRTIIRLDSLTECGLQQVHDDGVPSSSESTESGSYHTDRRQLDRVVSNCQATELKADALTIDQGHARAVRTAGANPREIAIKKLSAANFKAFFDDLGSKLVHAIVASPQEDMLDGTILVMRSSVLTDVLDAPITELAMGEEIDFCKNFLNGRALRRGGWSVLLQMRFVSEGRVLPSHPRYNSRKCSGQQGCQFRPRPLRATFPGELR